MSQIGSPPPSYRIFQNYFKNVDPPLGSISDIFEFENILMAEDPLTNILNYNKLKL